MNVFPYCSECDKFALVSCARCRSVFYCGRRCQKKHWQTGGHRSECSPENALSLISNSLASSKVIARDYSRPELSVFIFTWNMAGKSMPSNFWLKELLSTEAWTRAVFNSVTHDIYCFALQECPASDGLISALETKIQVVGNSYTRKIIQTTPVTAPKFNQKLCIWVRTSILDPGKVPNRKASSSSQFRTSKVCFGKKSTCSKGSLLVRVALREFPDVILIGSHFPFSPTKPDLGNTDRLIAYQKTLAKLNTLMKNDRSSFIFWAGDLNFRKTPEDQLVQSMKNGTAFVGFREREITFRETCKFANPPKSKHPEETARAYNSCRGEVARKRRDGTFYEPVDGGISCYDKSRIRSHCDRILYSATPALLEPSSPSNPPERDFKNFYLDAEYNSLYQEEFASTSDHNPVFALFKMQKTPFDPAPR